VSSAPSLPVGSRLGRASTIVGVFAVASFAVAGCNKSAGPAPMAAKKVEVEYALAVTKEVVDYEDFTGTLESPQKIDVTSRVTGYLEKINFTEGGEVKKGQVLFEIDPRPAKAELEKAEASLVQAKARQRRLQGDYLRAEDLIRGRSISKEEFEKVSGDLEEAKAAVGVADAGKLVAQLNYDYTKVLSPINGVVGRTMLHEGSLVKADTTMLTTIVSRQPMHAYFDVDARTLLKLRRLVNDGKVSKLADHVQVAMALADEEGFPHQGRFDFEDNAIDPATGTQRLRGEFDNADGLLAPGMFVRVRLQIGKAHAAVVVPEEGVGADQGQKFVYIVDPKNQIEYRKVDVGALEKGWRVVEKGIEPGEKIVVSGLQRIRPGMPVIAAERGAPPAKKATEPPVQVR
jgi:multidrug efflux system membrane fusion protein